MFPAIVGVAYSVNRGFFPPGRIALVLLGLAAAELISLLAVDFRTHWERLHKRPLSYPPLPGNPVFRLLPPNQIPMLMSALGILGVVVLSYFFYVAGPIVFYLLAAASVAACFYIFNPFAYSFLAVFFLPPILTGAVYTALSGTPESGAFLVGLPSAFILAGINVIFRRLYAFGEEFRPLRAMTVLLLFSLSLCAVVALISFFFLPRTANSASVVILIGLFFIFQIFKHEQNSPVPAVTAGIALYGITAICLAFSLIF